MGTQFEPAQPTQQSDRSERQILHDDTMAFANGKGPILSRADQHLAQGGQRAHDLSHFPSNEELLQQLRTDTRKWETAQTKEDAKPQPDFPSAQHRASEFTDHERGILNDKRRVAAYTPEQLRDIGQIADGVQHHNSKELQAVAQRYGGDPEKISELQAGVKLELERRHLDTQYSVGVGIDQAKSGEEQPYIRVESRNASTSREYDGPSSPAKSRFELDPIVKSFE
jgi:hypothetical protein